MTDQKQAPELLMKRKFFDVRDLTTRDSGEYYISEIEALAKQRDQALAREKALKSSYDNERKVLLDNVRPQDENRHLKAASAAREIAMRDRAAERIESIGFSAGLIRALPLSPDGQQALDDMLAEAWDEGYDIGVVDGSNEHEYCVDHNPYRKDAT